MSYIVQPEGPRRSTPLIIAGAVVILLVVALLAFAVGRHAGSDAPGQPRLTWSQIGGVPVPASPLHGPRLQNASGTASGFSHDAPGAALAAVHIFYRVLPSSPRAVVEETAERQCFGDVAGYLDQIRRFTPPRGETLRALSAEYYYRVLAGDPTGPTVRIAVAATIDAGAQGYVETVRNLRWVDGDWRMELPPPRPTLIASLDGYTVLGKTDD